MLYRFKSRASADLTMLEAPARQVLQAIGKSAAAQGVILPEDMPAAIAALERAAGAEKTRRDDDDDAESGAQTEQAVSLRQRAAPFIQMLRESAVAGERVTWGV